jgi:3-dehydroquinate synthase
VSARVVEVAVARPYRVHVGPGLLAHAAAEAATRERCAVICDERVLDLHGARLAALDGAPRLPLTPGEGSKDLATLGRALEFLATSGLDRGGLVLTLGGGVVTDLGGLAASLYMRGVDVVHCPTTLLAQVDAAVGGKTALNLAAGKNLAGSVHQPFAVHADTETLASLDDVELRWGGGVVV